MKKGEMITGMILFLFGGITVLLSLRMPIGNFRMAGTGLFPLLLGLLLMGLAGLFMVKIHLQGKKEIAQVRGPGAKSPSARQVVLFMGTMILAALLFNPLGYPGSSFLLMLALMRILGLRNWAFNILISGVTVVASYFLFVQWLKIPLPKGWIGL